jgi:hypothetical protein
MDRVQQVNWLREFAGNIVNMTSVNCDLRDVTANEIVDFALSKEGILSWSIELPRWFDKHDKNLLIEMVRDSLT